MKIILVDMDGVIADFEEGHVRLCRANSLPVVCEGQDRKQWDILDVIPEQYRNDVRHLWHQPGFFRNLKPIAAGITTVLNWQRAGHEVFLCTAPLSNSQTCVQEKLLWVEEHLGYAFVRRTIVTSDKTLVVGDYLIDDKPVIHGVNPAPSWEHLLFAAPYNLKEKSWTWSQLSEHENLRTS